MAVGVDALVERIDKGFNRLDAIEKRLDIMGKADEGVQIVRKALLDGRGNPLGGDGAALIGIDGSPTCHLLNMATGSGVKRKSIGQPTGMAGSFGEFAHLVGRWGYGGKMGDMGQIEKELANKFKSKPTGASAWGRVEKAALAEASGQTGGYAVPVQFYADLMRLVAEESFVRSRCTTLPMQSRSMLVPALTQSAAPAFGTSAFFGGIIASWQPEAATINESEPLFRQIELIARDLVFFTVASNQLLQDNAVALDTLLTTLFKEAMAWFIDFWVLRGNGAGQPLGVLNAPAAFSLTRAIASRFQLVDAAGMIARLLLSSWKNAIWVMHPSVIPQVVQMNDAGGRPVWLNPSPQGSSKEGGGAAGAMPMELFGIPIYFTEKVPVLGTKGDVMLLDLTKQLVGDRLAIQIETSPHVRFTTNQMVWRIVTRWDSQPWLDAAVTLADGAYQMSPYVILN